MAPMLPKNADAMHRIDNPIDVRPRLGTKVEIRPESGDFAYIVGRLTPREGCRSSSAEAARLAGIIPICFIGDGPIAEAEIAAPFNPSARDPRVA